MSTRPGRGSRPRRWHWSWSDGRRRVLGCSWVDSRVGPECPGRDLRDPSKHTPTGPGCVTPLLHFSSVAVPTCPKVTRTTSAPVHLRRGEDSTTPSSRGPRGRRRVRKTLDSWGQENPRSSRGPGCRRRVRCRRWVHGDTRTLGPRPSSRWEGPCRRRCFRHRYPGP